jgi:hypothetical protein
MVEQDWTPSSVTLGLLEELMKNGFMLAAELEAYQVPMDPTLLAHAEGYVVSFTAFYERGFASAVLRPRASSPDSLQSLAYCHARLLYQDQVLIICMTQDQLFHTYGQKCSQITKCHK